MSFSSCLLFPSVMLILHLHWIACSFLCTLHIFLIMIFGRLFFYTDVLLSQIFKHIFSETPKILFVYPLVALTLFYRCTHTCPIYPTELYEISESVFDLYIPWQGSLSPKAMLFLSNLFYFMTVNPSIGTKSNILL